MGLVDCKARGVVGEPGIYDGREVVVIYYSADIGIVVEEGVVVNGQVEIPGPGPLTNERYYIGLKFDSNVKTFPLRNDGTMNNKARLSEVSLYLDDNKGEGSVEIGGSKGDPIVKNIEFDKDFKQGRFRVNIGSAYEEEPYNNSYRTQ
jgi:hypothetical protein